MDAAARAALSEVDGPTISAIAAEIGWADDVERLFREGAPFVGALPASGVAERRVVREEREPVSDLMGRAEAQNAAIIASLRDDAHADELHAGAVADAALGRMTMPVPIDDLALHDKILAPRFSVEQGHKPDGSPKAFAPRDLAAAAPARRGAGARSRRLFSRESQRRYQRGGKMASRYYRPVVRIGKSLSRGGAARAIQPAAGRHPRARAQISVEIEFWKADVDSAFRRVPIQPGHRVVAWVTYRLRGRVMAAQHITLPFGGLACVHGWERAGAFLAAAARKLLRLPVLRYVDDFFSVERKGLAEHADQCFARLVRALLGPSAMQDRKMAWGPSIVILGLRVRSSASGFHVKPDDDKAKQWTAIIDGALRSGALTAGEASKMAGRLSWACCHVFERAGRSMVRPLFDQAHGSSPRLAEHACHALRWWRDVLARDIARARPWRCCDARPPALVLADARGSPARLAAILLTDDAFEWAEMAPPEEFLRLPRDGTLRARASGVMRLLQRIEHSQGPADCGARDAGAVRGTVHMGTHARRPPRRILLRQQRRRMHFQEGRR